VKEGLERGKVLELLAKRKLRSTSFLQNVIPYVDSRKRRKKKLGLGRKGESGEKRGEA